MISGYCQGYIVGKKDFLIVRGLHQKTGCFHNYRTVWKGGAQDRDFLISSITRNGPD